VLLFHDIAGKLQGTVYSSTNASPTAPKERVLVQVCTIYNSSESLDPCTEILASHSLTLHTFSHSLSQTRYDHHTSTCMHDQGCSYDIAMVFRGRISCHFFGRALKSIAVGLFCLWSCYSGWTSWICFMRDFFFLLGIHLCSTNCNCQVSRAWRLVSFGVCYGGFFCKVCACANKCRVFPDDRGVLLLGGGKLCWHNLVASIS
jgi:hypothetical protein